MPIINPPIYVQMRLLAPKQAQIEVAEVTFGSSHSAASRGLSTMQGSQIEARQGSLDQTERSVLESRVSACCLPHGKAATQKEQDFPARRSA